MSEPYENDIESEIENPSDFEGDPRTIAYQIASQVMEESNSGFVIVGSPILGETAAGYMYPDAVGIVINHAIGLTETSVAAILMELARQLESAVGTVEDYLEEVAEAGEVNDDE